MRRYDTAGLPAFRQPVASEWKRVGYASGEVVPDIEIARALVHGEVIGVRARLLAAVTGLQTVRNRTVVDAFRIRV